MLQQPHKIRPAPPLPSPGGFAEKLVNVNGPLAEFSAEPKPGRFRLSLVLRPTVWGGYTIERGSKGEARSDSRSAEGIELQEKQGGHDKQAFEGPPVRGETGSDFGPMETAEARHMAGAAAPSLQICLPCGDGPAHHSRRGIL